MDKPHPHPLTTTIPWAWQNLVMLLALVSWRGGVLDDRERRKRLKGLQMKCKAILFADQMIAWDNNEGRVSWDLGREKAERGWNHQAVFQAQPENEGAKPSRVGRLVFVAVHPAASSTCNSPTTSNHRISFILTTVCSGRYFRICMGYDPLKKNWNDHIFPIHFFPVQPEGGKQLHF